MSCIQQVLTRRSVRKYKPEPVSEEVLKNILEARRLATSTTNRQRARGIFLS
ncbi:MAG: nitroreductase family protein [Candidatus Bathyarchaeota archaeon]|nr:nitroreductase family protein [Candidatus Bathyarchaeota archaeon]